MTPDSEYDEEKDFVDDVKRPAAKTVQIKHRSSVSAEAFGIWNTKKQFEPRIVEKG